MDGEIEDAYADAIMFIMDAPNGKKAQQEAWKAYGSDAHIELDKYNNDGETWDEELGLFTQTRVDGDEVSNETYQNWLEALDTYEESIA